MDGAKQFLRTTNGVLFYSFILKVASLTSGTNATSTNGAYFFALNQETNTTTTLGATCWVRADGTGFDLGVNARTTTTNTVWSSGTTPLNTEKLIVVGYEIVPGGTNDVVKMWIDPSCGLSTPPSPSLVHTNTTLADLGELNRLIIRQDSASLTPTVEIDELRISFTWADATPAGLSGPSITSFSPSSGPVGTSVTINGSNFGTSPVVKFNGTAAVPAVNGAGTLITTTVPSGATSGKITVEVTGQSTATSATDFTVSSANSPQINSLTPAAIYTGLGQSVVITGSNFTGATGVTFNALNAVSFTVDNDTQITAIPPAGATTGPVMVTTANGTASATLTVTALDSNEANSGDYSNLTNAPSSLLLGTATKLLAGSVGSGDADYVNFTVPSGYRLNGLNLKYFSFTTDQVAFMALDGGASWTAGQITADMLGNSHFGTADLNTDLLTKMNVAGSFLPAGDYTLWIQQLGSTNTYVLEFELAAAPPLILSLNPASVGENAGATASTGTVGIPTALTNDLNVSMSSANTAAATVPASVTIPTGQTNATFSIAVVPNTNSYLSQSAVITAGAGGYANASATLTVTNVDVPPAPLAAKGWINEFHYDNAGTDTGEFVEIVLANSTPTNNVSLILYNGGNGTAYATYPLSAFAAGAVTNGFTVYSVATPGFQNGAPDGIALIIDGIPEDLVSIEGSFLATDGPASAYTLSDIGVFQAGTEPVGSSLYRFGPGSTGRDFGWAKSTVSTAGQPNDGQSLGASGVQGTGAVAIANSTPLSPLIGANIFPRNQTNQTLSLTLTGTLSSGTISAMRVTVPAQFAGLTNTNQITVNGTGATAAAVNLQAQAITITGLAVNQSNTATLNISGLTTPETAGSFSNDGNYSLTVETGTDGNVQPVLLQPNAIVVIPMAHLGDVDANGVTLDAGKSVAVQAVCTEENFNSSSSTSAFLQSGQPDGTNKAGINVYSALRNLFVRGDEYVVAGSVVNYNGLTEIVVSSSNQVVRLGAASSQPVPVTLTIGELTNAHEAYEGSLIRVVGLSKVSGTWATNQNLVMQSGGTNLNLRVATGSSATNEPIYPAGITGIYGQFVTNAPFVGGGVLHPRDPGDIEDAPGLRLSMASTFLYESTNLPTGGSPTSGTLTVARTGGNNTAELTVTLSAAPGGVLQVPATAIIPAGQASVDVTVQALDNSTYVSAGFTEVTITAAALASGLLDGTLKVTVLEDDAPSADTVPPVITIGGDNPLTILWGGTWIEAVTAFDAGDNAPVTPTKVGSVNTKVPGTYIVTYTATDSSSNTASTNLTVNVRFVGGGTNRGPDGLPDAVRFALGADGTNAMDLSLLPRSQMLNNALVLTYQGRPGSTPVELVPVVSTNLSDSNSWGTSGITVTNVGTTNVNGVTLERRQASVPMNDGARKFLRLRATTSQ